MRRLFYPLLLTALIGSAPVRSQTAGGPFADVPTSDPAYAAVQQLAAEGLFTGFPASTFNGKQTLTRYEIAVAIQRLFQEVSRSLSEPPRLDRSPAAEAANRFVLTRFPRKEPERSTRLAGLIEEFRSEVAMLGGEPDAMLARLSHAPSTESIAVPPRPEDELPAAYRARKLARREWNAGHVVLYTTGDDTTHLDPILAVPFHFSPIGPEGEMLTLARIEAHNDEAYRLVLERGLPPNTRLPWLSLIEHPETATEVAPVRVRLSPRAMACYFGELTVTVRRASMDMGRLSLHSRGWTHELEVPWPGAATLELFGGPPESELLFLRVPGESTPFTVIDLRCGEVLR